MNWKEVDYIPYMKKKPNPFKVLKFLSKILKSEFLTLKKTKKKPNYFKTEEFMSQSVKISTSRSN